MNRFRAFSTFSALLLGVVASASASTLLPGTTATPDVLTPAASSVLLATQSGAAIALTFSDNYIATVMSDPNNVFCSACLDFTYVFTDDGLGVNERFTAYNFIGFSTDAGYSGTKGLGINPGSVDRSTEGSVIGFNYSGDDTLLPGNTTSILIVETNALYFTAGTFTIQDGSTATVVGYAPAISAQTPEPAPLALLATGLLGAVGLIHRKQASLS